MRQLVALLIALALFGACRPALCADRWRSTPEVPPDSTLYRDLDKLVAFGLVEPPVRGQRQYERWEFARMAAEAEKKLAADDEKAKDSGSFDEFVKRKKRMREIDRVLTRFRDEFREELTDMGALEGERMRYRVHPLEKVIFNGTYLNSPPTQIPPNNGRGAIDAWVNPLADYNLGRHPIDGGLFAVEAVGRFDAGRFLSGYVSPRFEADMPSTNDDVQGHAYLQNGYATFRAGNFAIKAGRDSMIWGPGERGSLLFSTNPRPLDGVWITNPEPARLPWIFKYLGRWRYTLYGANFGPGYDLKYAWMAGYKLNLAPAKYVEIGFGHAVQMGGEGAPGLSAWEIIGEFTGFRPAGTSTTAPNKSNHMFEIDLLVRIPQLRGLEMYANVAIEDYWKSISKTLTQGCSYLAGVYLPALNPSGTLDLRIEFTTINPLQYRHGMYVDGWTLNQKLIGSDTGPDGQSVHALLRKTISPKMWAGLTFGWDYRQSNTYTELRNPNNTAGPIVKTAIGPTEQRWRGLVDLDWKLKPSATLHLTGGYERVGNLHYQQNVHKNNGIGAATLTLDLDRFFGFSAN